MRLVNKASRSLEWFPEGHAPPYVILSHRWGRDECSMQQYTEQCQQSADKWSAGTAKVMRLCEYIKDMPEEYIWADTCCIDKRSSSELQEAINSMWTWYRQASLCVVFMQDVKVHEDLTRTRQDFENSQWWTRGWTLQELLAPTNELFVDSDWKSVGSRADLASSIETACGISADFMGNVETIHAASVGQRMSWLARRQTSVVEDLAYCMLGIFDINITMLYGEGPKAFLRLQKAILETIDDESIFLWTCSDDTDLSRSTILAPTPSCFADFPKLGCQLDTYFPRDPCRTTARGLELELYGPRFSVLDDSLRVPLNCIRKEDKRRMYIRICRPEEAEHAWASWKRVEHNEIDVLNSSEYLGPSSEQLEFLEQKQKLMMSGWRTRGTGGPDHFAESTYHQFDFENEAVRRKVFVH